MKKLVFPAVLLLGFFIQALRLNLDAVEDSAKPVAPPPAGCWLWAGRSASAVPADLVQTAPVYVHQATFERPHPGREIPPVRRQGLGPINLPGRKIFIVYRLERLPNPAAVADLFSYDADMWRLRGNEIAGLQIDFDSPSGRLGAYIAFLQQLRTGLCDGCALSVTGLADWASSASRSELLRLADSTDEIIFQLYNGKSPIPALSQYAAHISRFERPFKVGILPSQRDNLPFNLLSSPQFRGAVIFLERT